MVARMLTIEVEDPVGIEVAALPKGPETYPSGEGSPGQLDIGVRT
jgi:hypothetical protein